MICKDILNMDSIRKNMNLVAGEEGLTRTLRWCQRR